MDVNLRDELAAILAETPPPTPSAGELAFLPIDNSPEAVKMRAIVRIANRYSWHEAIIYFLDTRGAAYLSDLSMPQLEDLLERMEGYVDAAECGHYLPDSLPAQ